MTGTHYRSPGTANQPFSPSLPSRAEEGLHPSFLEPTGSAEARDGSERGGVRLAPCHAQLLRKKSLVPPSDSTAGRALFCTPLGPLPQPAWSIHDEDAGHWMFQSREEEGREASLGQGGGQGVVSS